MPRKVMMLVLAVGVLSVPSLAGASSRRAPHHRPTQAHQKAPRHQAPKHARAAVAAAEPTPAAPPAQAAPEPAPRPAAVVQAWDDDEVPGRRRSK
jgi:hypothetical protein